MFIQNAKKGKNFIVRACGEIASESTLKVTIYDNINSSYYQKFIFVVISAHCFMYFVEPDNSERLMKTNTDEQWLVAPNLFFLAIEVLDWYLRWRFNSEWNSLRFMMQEADEMLLELAQMGQALDPSLVPTDLTQLREYILVNRRKYDDADCEEMVELSEKEQFGLTIPRNKYGKRWIILRHFNHENVKRLYLQGVIIAGIFINLLFTYLARLSFEYYIPIRPLLLIFRTDALFFVLYNFFRSLIDSKDVLFSFICLMSILSLWIIPLFANVNDNMLANSYSNIMRSLFTTMIFIMTGENHNEVFWEAKELHWWYIFFHIFCALIGLFMFVPIFISKFEEGFTKYNKARRIRNMALKRAGIVAAFTLLDANSDHSLDRVEFSRFMKLQVHTHSQSPERDDKIDRLWEKVNVNEDRCIHLQEFVTWFDKDDWAFQQIFVLSDVTKRSFEKTRKWIEIRILGDRRFKDVLLAICIIQTITHTLHGWILSYDEYALDLTSQICWGILTGEILIRILCMGWSRFFYYSRFPLLEESAQRAKPILYLDMIEIQNVNRYEVFFVLLPSVALLCFQHADFVNVSTTILRRTAFSLSVFRIMSLVKKNSIILVTIWQVLPDFISLATFIFLIMFMFALLTCNIFHNAFRSVVATETYNELDANANFDSIGNSLHTAFQMFIGEGWHHILWTVIESRAWASGIIIIVFVLLSTVLLASVFTAMLLSKFSILNRERLQHVNKQEIFGLQQGYSLYSGDNVKILATGITKFLEVRDLKNNDSYKTSSLYGYSSGYKERTHGVTHLTSVKEESADRLAVGRSLRSKSHYGNELMLQAEKALATATKYSEDQAMQIFEIHKVYDDKQPLKNGDQVVFSVPSLYRHNKPVLIRWSEAKGICTVANPNLKPSRSGDKRVTFHPISDYNLSSFTFSVRILKTEVDDKGVIKDGISKIRLTPQVRATKKQQTEFWDRFSIWQRVLSDQLEAEKELECHYSTEDGNVIRLREISMEERPILGGASATIIEEKAHEEDSTWDNTEFVIFRHQVDHERNDSLRIPGCCDNLMHKIFGCKRIISENVGKKNLEDKIRALNDENQKKETEADDDQLYISNLSNFTPRSKLVSAGDSDNSQFVFSGNAIPRKGTFNPRISGLDMKAMESKASSKGKVLRKRSQQALNKLSFAKAFASNRTLRFGSVNM